MQFNLNRDIAEWLDRVRGDCSRQQYIAQLLRQHMKQEQDTTNKGHYEANHSNGAINALPQV